MKKNLLTLAMCLTACFSYAQTGTYAKIITTGNNVVSSTDPKAADMVIGSDAGVRHDASIMWWSSNSASRISNTSDVFYLSVWNTTTPNIALSATVGGTSYFQGNVLMGKSSQVNAAYKLDVAGNVRANQLVVNTTGADFVFDPSSRLYPLSSLEKYIEQNHHLPEIASAKQMQADGLNVGENQVKLLQKVEELTLYLIEKDKEVKELKDRLAQIEKIQNQK
ncbi:MAG: hypothetical protein JWR09_3979 [Mucilaginibacter sp.]|nr:hypothetical protein [Mucilaginibacter sp.]